MKLIILVAVLFFSVDAIGAADTTLTHQPTPEPPVRLIDENGAPLPPQDIWIIHDKDCDQNGWRFNNIEWRKMLNGRPEPPEYYFDPVHGSNGGIDIT